MLNTPKPEQVVVHFAGGGGSCTGLLRATGRSPDLAVNHSEVALAMHRANHPDTEHRVEDVFHVDPDEVRQKGPLGVAWFSPDCFPAGTMVLTESGYRPIEFLQLGDKVLTHKQRWRAVTAVMRSSKPLVVLKGHGHPGLLVSQEHPFFVRKRKDVWDTTPPRGYTRTLKSPEWAPASALGKGWYWASPAAFPSLAVPPVGGGKFKRVMKIDARLLWLAGLYVADGWTRLTSTRAELVITCGRHEVDKLREQLSEWGRAGTKAGADELAWHDRATSTAHQFTTNHRGMVKWLRDQFGHGASEKRIPGWLLGAPTAERKAFLDGYLQGDGCLSCSSGANGSTPIVMATTVSKSLVFGLKALAGTFGFTSSVYVNNRPNCVIQGRKVDAKPSWSVRWREQPESKHVQCFNEDGFIWTAVKSSTLVSPEVVEVFNVSVAEDESYVVEGIVVHNCTHHSKARNGKPADKKIRGLVLVMLRWAKARTRVMFMENVEEITGWGPLKRFRRNGESVLLPDPDLKGRTWSAFLACISTGIAPDHPDLPFFEQVLKGQVSREEMIQGFGYRYDCRALRASNYGTPTLRKRLYGVFRCDQAPIVWPSATHGTAAPLAWRPVAQCIDWTRPCPSIFLTGKAAKKANCRRPLAPATLRRIAKGVDRYVLKASAPFIVSLTHQGGDRVEAVTEPAKTITGAHRGEKALVVPSLAGLVTEHAQSGNQRNMPVTEPLRTLCAGVKGGHFGLVAGTMVQVGYGEREGQAPRVLDLQAPLGTVTAGGGKHAVVAGSLIKMRGDNIGSAADAPVGVVTAGGQHHALLSASLMQFRHDHVGSPVTDPAPTITAGSHRPETHGGAASTLGVQVAYLAQHNGGFNVVDGRPVTEPISTLSTRGSQQQLVTASVAVYYGSELDGHPATEPAPTLTTKARLGVQEAVAVSSGLSPEQHKGALRVAKFLRRHGVEFDGPYATVLGFVIVDLGMRMLTPRELFLAMGFPPDFVIDYGVFIHPKTGEPYRRALTKEEQIRLCGNAVCPDVAMHLARANVPELCIQRS